MGSTIVNTRAPGDEAPLSEALRERGHHVIHEPLTQIVLHHTAHTSVEKALFTDPDGVIITSRHGAQALAALTTWRDQSLLAVGNATAEAALSLGFTRVTAAGGDMTQLIQMISDAYDEGSHFLYLSAEHVRGDLVEELTARGMRVQRIVVYEAVAADQFSDTLIEQMNRGNIDGITFFSQRAAETFNRLLAAANAGASVQSIRAFALSDAIADTLRHHAWHSVEVAGEATLASLVECVDNGSHAG